MLSTIELLKRLIREHGRDYAPQYAVVVVCMALVAGTTALSAYVMKYVIDSIFVNQSRSALYGITLGIVVIFFVKGVAAYFSEVVLGTIGNRLVAQSQRRMSEHMLKANVGFFQTHTSSDLITRISHNAASVRDMLNMVSLTLGRDLFTIIGLVVAMIVLDPIMTAIAFIGGPVAALTSRKLVERVQKATRSEVNSITGIINTTRELSQGVHVVKSFQLENTMRARMSEAISAVERLSNKMLRVEAAVNPLMETLAGVAVALVVLYAGWRNLNYGDTPGQFFAFITALLMCADPARRLSRVHLKIATAAIGVRMMYELLDLTSIEIDSPDQPALKVTGGEIIFDDVTFGYVTGEPVLRGLSLIAPPGKTTALVGMSGGGKTTALALLQRFREPQSGKILIDGQSIGQSSLSSLRHNITMVSQDVFLFEGTVLDNIRAGLAGATDEQCFAAARAASAHDFITSLPRSYSSQVGELGSQLSGGQKQRIGLARAFLKNAPICFWMNRHRLSTAKQKSTSSVNCGNLLRAAQRSSSPIVYRPSCMRISFT